MSDVSTLYMSNENAASYVLRPRFDALKGDAGRFHLLKGGICSSGEGEVRTGMTLKDVGLLEAALVKTGAKLIIVDPIQSYLGEDTDAYRSNETRPIMDGLITLAEEHNVCVLILRHLSKASGGRAIHRGLGTIDFTGAVRTEMIAGTAPGDPDSRAMVQIKNNLGPKADSLGYEIVGTEMNARLEWLGKSDLTANDLLAPDATASRSAVDDAREWLRDFLSNGSKEQRECREKAESVGISFATLRRAKNALRVRSCKPALRGAWIWALPDPPRGAQDLPQGAHTRKLSALGFVGHLASGSDVPSGSKDICRTPLNCQAAQESVCEQVGKHLEHLGNGMPHAEQESAPAHPDLTDHTRQPDARSHTPHDDSVQAGESPCERTDQKERAEHIERVEHGSDLSYPSPSADGPEGEPEVWL